MARKQTFSERLIEFGLSATSEELDFAINTLRSFRVNRFPVKKTVPRKPRSDKGARRKSEDFDLIEDVAVI